jgi:hypothetical protein
MYSSGGNTPLSPVSNQGSGQNVAEGTSVAGGASPIICSSPSMSMTRGILNCKIESDMKFSDSSVSPVRAVDSPAVKVRKPESDFDDAHVHPAPSSGKSLRTSAVQKRSYDSQQAPAKERGRILAKQPTDSQSRQLSMFSWTQDDTKSESSNSEHGGESPAGESPDQQSKEGNNRTSPEKNSSPLFSLIER